MSPVSETPQTMLDALRSDHHALADMLADPAAVAESHAALRLREQLVMEMVRHFVAEEQYLYPLMREKLSDGDELADSEFTRDRACEHQLKQLEARDLTHERLTPLWQQIGMAFAAHVEDQETVFAQLAQTVDAETLVHLAAEVRGAEQLAPTRPRSISPEGAGPNKFTSLVEGFFDHVRDAYSHRGDPEK